MHTKSVPFELKSGTDEGTFEALVAVFGNVDRGGDRIVPGAFKDTLAKWSASGDPIPVIFNHAWSDAHAHVGVVDQAMETPKGLLVKGKLDVSDNDVARQVYKLMKRRTLKEFSFGYEVPKGGEKRAKDGANELLAIDLVEVGPTLKGMNDSTELLAVKSALVADAAPDPEALRREATRVERELEAQRLPELPDNDDPVKNLPTVRAGEKQLASMTRELLDGAGKERFGAAQDTYVYVDDFDPDGDWVVFCISSDTGESRYVKTTYAIAADNTVTLGDAETEVTRATSYQPKGEPQPPPDVEAQRKEANRVAQELEAEQLPDISPVEAEPEPEIDLVKELQEVKDRLAASEKALEDLTKKAEVADREPSARSADPLRQQAEAVALEVASGGLPKPPKTVAAKRAEPSIPLDELKQRCRDEMLGVLSGGLNEQV
jgi:uncharacterized protein